jgi:hypothetical protein
MRKSRASTCTAGDVRLMREASVNVATLPVFRWVALQPNADTFFLRVARPRPRQDKLHAGGIGACLATGTASTPAWLDRKYPDVLRVDYQGRKLKHGNRHTFCPCSPSFRRLSVNLAHEMARRCRGHPALLLWHVSNEYGNACYCGQCAQGFRDWLKERRSTWPRTWRGPPCAASTARSARGRPSGAGKRARGSRGRAARGPRRARSAVRAQSQRASVQASLPNGAARDLISERELSGEVELEGYDVLILEEAGE